MIQKKDSLEFLKEQKDCSIDINYSDPPYALGSEILIKDNGKVDYKKATDFMNRWEMPNGEYWEQWFKEAYRSLKHGGYCIMFGIDRQLLLFKYYGVMSGFIEKQSLYWYFISNFPKSSDLSKNLDKYFNAEREIIGERFDGKGSDSGSGIYQMNNGNSNMSNKINIEKPQTELAQKYSGYKYSISPLKQTCETILVFQKPYKTGSCLHDTLAFENGDNECCCGALNIDESRVDFISNADRKESITKNQHADFGTKPMTNNVVYGDYSMIEPKNFNPIGRFPSQTFVSNETAKVLDNQSGISQSTPFGNPTSSFGVSQKKNDITDEGTGFDDIGGCSKILHKCNFENGEFDLFFYEPKVGSSERNLGCEKLEKKDCKTGIDTEGRTKNDLMDRFEKTNNHPTLKPIELNKKILSLFKTPNPQKIIYPYAGSGSEIIGGIRADFFDWEACEINEEYIEIAKARIEYWKNKDYVITNEKGETKRGLFAFK